MYRVSGSTPVGDVAEFGSVRKSIRKVHSDPSLPQFASLDPQPFPSPY